MDDCHATVVISRGKKKPLCEVEKIKVRPCCAVQSHSGESLNTFTVAGVPACSTVEGILISLVQTLNFFTAGALEDSRWGEQGQAGNHW